MRLLEAVQQYIGRFQVPMKRALLVGVMDGLSDGFQPAGQLSEIPLLPSASVSELPQALAFDVIHREIVMAILFADLMDGDDVGMTQIGRRFGLRAKPRHI